MTKAHILDVSGWSGPEERAELLQQLLKAAADAYAATPFRLIAQGDGEPAFHPKLHKRCVERSRLLCDMLSAFEGSEQVFTVPFRPAHIFAWHYLEMNSCASDPETLCKVLGVASFLQDDVGQAATATHLAAVLRAKLLETPLAVGLPAAKRRWHTAAKVTVPMRQLRGSDLQCVAGHLHLDEALAAPDFLLRACLQSMRARSAFLDMSNIVPLQGCNAWRSCMKRVMNEVAALGFSRIIMPAINMFDLEKLPEGSTSGTQQGLEWLEMKDVLSVSFSSCKDGVDANAVKRVLASVQCVQEVELPPIDPRGDTWGNQHRFPYSDATLTAIGARLTELTALRSVIVGAAPGHAVRLLVTSLRGVAYLTRLQLPGATSSEASGTFQEQLPDLQGISSSLAALKTLKVLHFQLEKFSRVDLVTNTADGLIPLSSLTDLETLHVRHAGPCVMLLRAPRSFGMFLKNLAVALDPLKALRVLRFECNAVPQTLLNVTDALVATFKGFAGRLEDLEVVNNRGHNMLLPFGALLSGLTCMRRMHVAPTLYQCARVLPQAAVQLQHLDHLTKLLLNIETTQQDGKLVDNWQGLELLGALKQLRVFELTAPCEPDDGAWLACIAALPTLQELGVRYWEWTAPAGWARLARAHACTVASFASLSDSYGDLRMAESLTRLALHNVCGGMAQGPDDYALLAGLTGLRELRVTGSSATGALGPHPELQFLQCMPQLETLSLPLKLQGEDEEALAEAVAACSHLTALRLALHGASGGMLATLTAHLSCLQRLEVLDVFEGVRVVLALPNIVATGDHQMGNGDPDQVDEVELGETCALTRAAQQWLQRTHAGRQRPRQAEREWLQVLQESGVAKVAGVRVPLRPLAGVVAACAMLRQAKEGAQQEQFQFVQPCAWLRSRGPRYS